jgi:hypothetical protein
MNQLARSSPPIVMLDLAFDLAMYHEVSSMSLQSALLDSRHIALRLFQLEARVAQMPGATLSHIVLVNWHANSVVACLIRKVNVPNESLRGDSDAVT